jgi:hypothetical protein
VDLKQQERKKMRNISTSVFALAAFLAGCSSDGDSGPNVSTDDERAAEGISIKEERDTHKFVGTEIGNPLSAFANMAPGDLDADTDLSSIKNRFDKAFADTVIGEDGKLIKADGNLLVDKITLARVAGNAGLQAGNEFGYTSLNVWSKNYNNQPNYKTLELATAIPEDKLKWINDNFTALKTAVATMTSGKNYAAVVTAVDAYIDNPSGETEGGLADFLKSDGAGAIIADVWPLFGAYGDQANARKISFLATLDTADGDDDFKFKLIYLSKMLYAISGNSAFHDGDAIAYDSYVKGDAERQITNQFMGMNENSYTFTGKAVGGITQSVDALDFADKSTSFVRSADLSGDATLTLNPKSRKDDTLALTFNGLGMTFKSGNTVEISGELAGFKDFSTGGTGTFDATYYGLSANSVVNGSGEAHEALGRFQYSHEATRTDIRGSFGVKR